jgi:hypothetical protein
MVPELPVSRDGRPSPSTPISGEHVDDLPVIAAGLSTTAAVGVAWLRRWR